MHLLGVHFKAYRSVRNFLFRLDHLHPEEWHKHSQLRVALPVEGILWDGSLP